MSDGPARKGFDGDLTDGKLREDAFGRLLLGGRELWEHKRDYKCCCTGNLALEYQTSQLPRGEGRVWRSGIATCEAYWFVLEYAHERRLVWPLADVKALARRAVQAGLHKWIGDDNRFHNALVPLEWFFENEVHLEEVA